MVKMVIRVYYSLSIDNNITMCINRHNRLFITVQGVYDKY